MYLQTYFEAAADSYSLHRYILIINNHQNQTCVLYTTKSYFIIFISDSIATDASVSQSPSGSASADLANDGSISSCSNTKGNNIQFQVDLNKESIVKGMYITFGGMLIINIYMQ